MVEQARENLKRHLHMFMGRAARRDKAIFVGGGPSLKDDLHVIRFRYERGGLIWAMNGTHDWLIERGLYPDVHVLLDARPETAEFVRRPDSRCIYLVAAQCHPDVFDALSKHRVMMWVADAPGMRELADETAKPIVLVGGGSTVGLKALMLAHLWGYRDMRLFGYDSSYAGDAHHAYPQPLNDGEQVHEISYCGRHFMAARWMVAQAEDFMGDAQLLMRSGTRLTVHGDGLLPHMFRTNEKGQDNAA